MFSMISAQQIRLGHPHGHVGPTVVLIAPRDRLLLSEQIPPDGSSDVV
jgi:hypothetical protein